MIRNTDVNSNYLPAFYIKNTTNSSTHVQQVFQSLDELRRYGHQRVPFSAHLKKCLYDVSENNDYQYYLENRIMPMLKNRANLPGDENTSIVFVYDIEEITMMSEDYRMELINQRQFDILRNYLLVWNIFGSLQFNAMHLSEEDVITIDDVFNTEMETIKKEDSPYKDLRILYNKVSNSKFDRKKSIINEELFKTCEITNDYEKQLIYHSALQFQKLYFQRWKCVEKCLKLVKKRSKSNKKFENIALVKRSLVQGAIQLLISGHSSQIPIENIYSWQFKSKESVLEKIQKRFGDKCTLIYITSSTDVNTIHDQMNIPIWTIQARESIELLYKAQRDHMLH